MGAKVNLEGQIDHGEEEGDDQVEHQWDDESVGDISSGREEWCAGSDGERGVRGLA